MLRQVTKKIIQQVFYGNYFIAFGAFLLAFEAFLLRGIEINRTVIYYACLLFFSTHFAYHFHRFFGVKLIDNYIVSDRHRWYDNNQNTQKALAMVSLIGAAGFLYLLGASFVFYLIAASVLSALYNFKIGSFKGLRHIPLIKTIIISLAWGLSFSIPLLYFNFAWQQVFLFFIRYSFFIYALTIPFDIRDVNRDPHWLKTLPQLYGIKKSKAIALLCLLVSSATCLGFEFKFWIAETLVLIYFFVLLNKTEANAHDYYFLIGYDFIIILKTALIYWLSF